MSWRQSTGRDVCNTCRRTVDLAAPVYAGEHTPTIWCEGCAATSVGQTVTGPVPVRVEGKFDGFDPKAMGARLRQAIISRRRDGRQLATGERE